MSGNQELDEENSESSSLVADQKRLVERVFGSHANQYVASEFHARGADLQRMDRVVGCGGADPRAGRTLVKDVFFFRLGG